MSIGEAERVIGFHLYRPHHALANDAIARVFVAGAPGQPHHPGLRIGIDYRSGIVMWVDRARGPYATDPEGFYRERAHSIANAVASGMTAQGTIAEVRTILWSPALVAQSCLGWGGVDVFIGGLRIEISAGWDRFDAASLVEVATTIT